MSHRGHTTPPKVISSLPKASYRTTHSLQVTLFLNGLREKLERSLVWMLNYEVPTVWWKDSQLYIYNRSLGVYSCPTYKFSLIIPGHCYTLLQDSPYANRDSGALKDSLQGMWGLCKLAADISGATCSSVFDHLPQYLQVAHSLVISWGAVLFTLYSCIGLSECQNCPLIVGYCTVKTCILTVNDRHPMDLTWMPLP